MIRKLVEKYGFGPDYIDLTEAQENEIEKLFPQAKENILAIEEDLGSCPTSSTSRKKKN